MTIERVRVLNGHTSMDTAYLVDDYPYGYSLRCKIRYWVETATKGAKKGQMRFVSQTTNPKVAGEVWNTPKSGTYSELTGMYLNHEDHVEPWGIDRWLSPVGDARLRLMGIYDQLTEDDRTRYDMLRESSRGYAEPWDEWDEVVAALAHHISQTGHEPDVENGVWQGPKGRRYLSDVAVYFAAARERLSNG